MFFSDDLPFSKELKEFMYKNKDFFNSLKLSKPDKFKYIPIVITSRTPNTHKLHNDEIIGMWYFDIDKKIYKQDFIVNKEKSNCVFISYTAKKIVKQLNSSFVKCIDDFFIDYGEYKKFYHNEERWQHHYKNKRELPNCIRDYVLKNKIHF